MAKPAIITEDGYDHERAARWRWQLRREGGWSRREFARLLAAGAGLAAFSRLGGGVKLARADHVTVVKPTPAEWFYELGSNRETRWEVMAQEGYLTPNHLFFVRNHSATPHIDEASWRLTVGGSGVERPVELCYDDLLDMDCVTVTKAIECAGNARSFFASAQGRRASGTQWGLGAIGVAEWTGVPLCEVLERARLKRTAVDLMPIGLDSALAGRGHVRRPLPIEKALDDVLLVYGMNGEPLPVDHGFPARMLVPGWIGIANIKWVGHIEVSETPLFSDWNTNSYVMIGDEYPDRPVLTTQNMKSAFELAWPALLTAGRTVLTGRSWSTVSRVAAVQVSWDGGQSWQFARLSRKNLPQAWVRWAIEWHAVPGQYLLQARAIDRDGNAQPLSVPFNEQGYLYDAVVDHPVTVVP